MELPNKVTIFELKEGAVLTVIYTLWCIGFYCWPGTHIDTATCTSGPYYFWAYSKWVFPFGTLLSIIALGIKYWAITKIPEAHHKPYAVTSTLINGTLECLLAVTWLFCCFTYNPESCESSELQFFMWFTAWFPAAAFALICTFNCIVFIKQCCFDREEEGLY